MRKTITLILLSLFIVGSAFAQVRELPQSKNYREVDQSDQRKTQIKEKKDIQSKDGQLEVEGFEDVTDSWPAGWMTASSSDLSGSNWQNTDFTQGDNTWFVNTPESFGGDGGDYIYNGDRSAAIGFTAGETGNSMHWLVSKELELPSDTAFLSFMTWFQCSNEDGWYTYFHVQIEVDGQWENLASWDADSEEYVNLWEEPVDIDLSDYTGKTVRLGFVYEYNDGFQMALDSIAYMNVPPADDAGISKFLSPESGVYETGEKDVEVVLKNYGADTLTSADIHWGVETGGDFNQESTESWTGELAQNETDTLTLGSYNFTDRGEYTVKSFTSNPNDAEDVNVNNDTSSVSLTVYEDGQLFEDYEEGSFVDGWESINLWEVADFNPHEGTYHAMIEHNNWSAEAKMITPKVVIDGSVPDISFYAGGMNNTAGFGSSKLQLMYSTDKENWEEVGPQIDFAEEGDNYKKYSIELAIPDGEYYLAFSGTSDFNYYYDPSYNSYVIIDDVIGPFLTAPEPETYTPANGAAGVNLDAAVSVEFDQEVDSVDFSGITITGENEGEVGNVEAALAADNSTITIDHDPFAGNNEEYTVTIPAGTVTNGASENEEISWTFTSIMAAPQYSVLYPENEAQGVPFDEEVSVIFDQEISDNDLASVTMTGNVQGAIGNVNATVSQDNKTVVISHDDFTEYEDTINVTIPADAVVNEDGVTNADPVEWLFYTLKEGQPVADSLAPANNKTGVALDADVLIRFSPDVTETDLSGVTIEGENEGQVSNVDATLTDSTLHIAHDPFANNNELYTVTVPAGAVESATEPNSEIKWNFTTIKTAPQLVEMTPADGATKVALDQDIMFSFDQEIDTDYSLDTMITIIGENEDTVQNLNATMHPDGMGFTITHDGMENNNAQYTVTVPANLVYNSDDIMNEEEVSWTFTTIMDAPAPEEYTPGEDAIDVPLDAEVSLVLDQDVTVNDLSVVTIESQANGSVSNVNATLEDDNRTITIDHDRFFDTNDDTYTVSIPARSLMNADEVYNEKITWSFNTIETHDVTFLVKSATDSIEGATVEFSEFTEVTDTNGIALFDGVAVGESIPYKAYKEDYDTIQGSVDVTEPMYIVLTMEEAYTVTFSVTDGSASLDGAEVNFNSETKTTDSEGDVVFKNVNPADNMVYFVSKDQYESAYGTISVESNMTKNVVLQEVVTGVNKLDEYGIDVYPVPTTDVLNIDNLPVTGEQKVEIIDVTGKVVYSRSHTNVNTDINVSDLNEGMYFLRLHLENEVINSKISIK